MQPEKQHRRNFPRGTGKINTLAMALLCFVPSIGVEDGAPVELTTFTRKWLEHTAELLCTRQRA